MVAPNASDMAGAEEVSLGSDELSESFTATEFTTEQDQGRWEDSVSQDQFSRDQLPPDQLS